MCPACLGYPLRGSTQAEPHLDLLSSFDAANPCGQQTLILTTEVFRPIVVLDFVKGSLPEKNAEHHIMP